MKVVNDLLGYKNFKIVQNDEWFVFSLDSVLLPNFVRLNKSDKAILDIGTGNAPIPLILSTKTDAIIYGIEIQKDVYDMAVESVNLNSCSNQIKLINDDVNNIDKYFKPEFFDVIVSNPPYFKLNKDSIINKANSKALARHEITLDLKHLIQIASKYLKNNGKFAMIHRTERLTEVLSLLSEYKLEPKRVKLIFPKKYSDSNLFIVEAVKNANPGIKSLTHIIIHDDNGQYTEEVKRYFE